MLAPMMLGEYVGWRRWLAVSIGFAGMIVVPRPGGGSLQWVALLPLGAAACGAFRDIITRKINAVDTALGTLFVSTALVTFGGLLSLPWGWQPLDLRSAALFLCNGILLTGAHYLLIEALRYAEAAAVSPFKYVSLLWAVLLGYLIWGDVPTLATLLGAGMIVLAGLFIFHREKVKAAR